MSTPDFIEWLDRKIERYAPGKLIPPDQVLKEELQKKTREEIEQRIKEKILEENNAEGEIMLAYEDIMPKLDEASETLKDEVEEALDEYPTQLWRKPVTNEARNLVDANLDDGITIRPLRRAIVAIPTNGRTVRVRFR